MSKPLTAIAVLALIQGTARGQRSDTIFQNLFTTIAAPANSTPIRNIGQSGHVLLVLLTANAPAVCASPQVISAGLEGSFDNIVWTPVGTQLIAATADLNGNIVGLAQAQGAWPYIRAAIRAFDNINCRLTARYSGTVVTTPNINVAATTAVTISGGTLTGITNPVTVTGSLTAALETACPAPAAVWDSGIVAVPLAEAPVSAVATCVHTLFLTNTAATSATISVRDNQGAPVTYLESFVVPARSLLALNLAGVRFAGGVRWIASAAGVNGQILGRR